MRECLQLPVIKNRKALFKEGNINIFKKGDAHGIFREIAIPGDVLGDERLTDGAKIMYGKIARLSLADGYCWAGNSFLDGTESGRSASRLVAELKERGYVSVENEGSRFRKIRICGVKSKINAEPEGPVSASSGDVENTDLAKFGDVEKPDGLDPAISGGVENSDPAKFGDVEKTDGPDPAISGGVEGKKDPDLAKFGDRTSSSSYINSTTTTAPGHKNLQSQKEPLPAEEKTAAAALSPQKLKEALSAVDGRLSFDENFYRRAAAFMAQRGLGFKYLSWLHEQCLLKENIRSLKPYYFSIFFLENMAEEYRAAALPEAGPPPPAPTFACPACGLERRQRDGDCPSCGLYEIPTPGQVVYFSELFCLPPGKKDEYLRREESLYSAGFKNYEEINKLKTMAAALRREFGLTAGP